MPKATKPTDHVDAIVCYHNHKDHIEACIDSLEPQVRHILVVDDGSTAKAALVQKKSWTLPNFVYWQRAKSHSPANSFNYGAFHSNADWLLYVDPHNIYRKGAVQQLLDHAMKEGYDCVFGTGQHYLLGPEDRWVKALKDTINVQVAPWTFLMHRTLWEELGGIPEPPYAHVPVLMRLLTRRGVRAGAVEGCVDHVVNGDFRSVVGAFYEAGRMDAVLHAHNVEHDTKAEVSVARIKEVVGDAELQTLFNLVFMGMYQLGVIDGLDAIPQAPVKLDLRFRWETE